MGLRFQLAYLIVLGVKIKNGDVWNEYHVAVDEYLNYIKATNYCTFRDFLFGSLMCKLKEE